jgi:hypothetical protein
MTVHFTLADAPCIIGMGIQYLFMDMDFVGILYSGQFPHPLAASVDSELQTSRFK